MARAWIVGLCLLAAVGGCSHKSPSNSEQAHSGTDSVASNTNSALPVDPNHPNATLYEQLHSGAFQYDTAGDNLQDASDTLEAIKPGSDSNLAGALKDLSDSLDDAGGSIGDFADPPASEDAVKADFKTYDDKRLKAIEAGNDALHALYDAEGMIDDLKQDAKYSGRKDLDDIMKFLDLAIDNITGGVQSLGGKVEEDTDSD